MLKRYLVTDVAVLDRIRSWVAVSDHRAQLIESRVSDAVEYHVILNLHYGHLDRVDLFTTEFQDAVSECEFPRRH
jgi:hypothetical protein